MTGAFGEGVDIDLLADYIGGALEGTPDEAMVAELIATDPRWRATHETLTGGMDRVGAVLAAFEPAPMPAEVAERLDTLFRAPAGSQPVSDGPDHLPGRADDGAALQGQGLADVVHLQKTREKRAADSRRRRWTTPVAIAAGLVAFVGFGADYLSGRSNDEKSSDSSAGFSAAAPAEGSVVLTTGMNYTAATLADPPMQPLLAPSAAHLKSPSSLQGQDAPGLTALTAQAALQACLQAIEAENGAGTIVTESVDYARFNGSPALIVRFTATNGAWAVAAGPECGVSGGGADSLAKVPLR